MKLPRSFKIFRLVRRAGSSFLHNEPYTLSDSLQDLDDLGGVYIKFLQMVVLQMEPHAQRDFGQVLAVFEHSKADDVDIIRYLKRAQPRLMRHIVMLEPKPFATGSFGQVYRAQLDNGDDVVIKVLRPSVVKYLKSDLRLLSFMTFWVGVFDRQKLFNFRNIYKQFRTTSLRETNYLREAAVSSAYYKSFKDHPHLVVPRTYQGLSSKTVLVQQNIHGLSVASVLERQAAHGDAREYVMQQMGSDMFQQLHVVGYELLTKALMGEVFHSDPHPGNILLLPENKVALIDFGMTAQLNDGRMAFYELLIEYQKYYGGKLEIDSFMMASLKMLAPDFFQALQSADGLFGEEEKGVLLNRIRTVAKAAADAEDVQPLIAYCMERKMIMKILLFAVNKQNRFGLTLDMRTATTLKAVQTFIVLVLKFDPDSVIIQRVINDAVATGANRMDEIADIHTRSYRPHEALDVVSVWFDKIARNDPSFLYHLAGKYVE